MRFIKVIFVILFLIFFYGGWNYRQDFNSTQGNWEKITSIVLILTLFVIIWYAVETGRLRKATIKQTETMLRPFIILEIIAGIPHRFAFVNIGKGPALKIKMKDITIIGGEELTIQYSFEEIDILNPKERKIINVKTNNESATVFHLGSILPKSANRSFAFEIEYFDMNNKQYKTAGRLGKGGIFIERTI